jgi:serine/threonine protein kinase
VSEDWPIAGTLLAARYRLVELLEIGGMSQIWRAEDELLGRPVAVKLPLGTQVVWREARMAAKLQHPNIAAVHDYREAVRPDGSVTPFVVMELLAGESVAARLSREVIGLPEAARIGAAVADALAAAHASGVVHRDIKPGNVMLTPTGVKILDFGISATAGEPDDDASGSTFGTPAYVAPERLDGMPAEPATDVYGLGVLLFEMVTGDPPYPVDTWEELAEARAGGPPRPLPPEVPDAFRELVDRCLDESPSDRPAAAEVRFDLTALWLKPTAPDFFRPVPAEGWNGPAHADPGPADSSKSRAEDAGVVNGYVPGRVAASGRAPATTIALTRPPARRLTLVVSVVALVVALGGVFAIVNWPRQTIDANPELPPPVVVTSEPVRPLDTPGPTTPAPTSASPSPKSSPKLSFDDAVSRFRSAVEKGAAGGDIRSDVATDLLNLLQPLTRSGGDVDHQVSQLRRLADLDRAATTL